MTEVVTRNGSDKRSGFALAACVAVGVFIGLMCGLSLARRLVPAPTEPRLIMQLLATQQEMLSAKAKAGLCEPPSAVRGNALVALTDLVSPSMRDTLVVDAAFERKVEQLRLSVQRLATTSTRGCEEHRRLLAAVDAACRECHLEYRTGESK